MQKSLLIIHPEDSTTGFLDKIKNHLNGELTDLTHHYNVKPNEESHQNCLQSISEHPENGLILFMGHGRSNYLYGAKGKSFDNAFVSEDAKKEHSEDYFHKEEFITFDNIDKFKKKKVFCLTCNSNGKIGKESIKKGAKVFLGFGDLPTSIEELKEQGEENKPGTSLASIERVLKTEINYIIKKSITIGIKKNQTFEQLFELIRFMTNQRISYYLVDQKKVSERKLIANYLYDFKKGIVVYGNGKEKLIG
ncbi:hypothetical protein SAMN04487762_1908 [Polaribacter sp. Hel1_33_78]|uniref:hypothetical protein n=1 Tax=Polaribacter sp. Hel1_33_78 TaxID=1336804 RepID=UPI00087AC74C|nr:hypothetical protein [Polaribacter sp. Hel1_33_78]SDU11885.1 hypothetical protein SAMN04487762_1908 [Polaribacter sp. Hel1_33_78]